MDHNIQKFCRHSSQWQQKANFGDEISGWAIRFPTKFSCYYGPTSCFSKKVKWTKDDRRGTIDEGPYGPYGPDGPYGRGRWTLMDRLTADS